MRHPPTRFVLLQPPTDRRRLRGFPRQRDRGERRLWPGVPRPVHGGGGGREATGRVRAAGPPQFPQGGAGACACANESSRVKLRSGLCVSVCVSLSSQLWILSPLPPLLLLLLLLLLLWLLYIGTRSPRWNPLVARGVAGKAVAELKQGNFRHPHNMGVRFFFFIRAIQDFATVCLFVWRADSSTCFGRMAVRLRSFASLRAFSSCVCASLFMDLFRVLLLSSLHARMPHGGL